MADLSQVEDALVAALAAAVYPGGPATPSAVGSPVKLYRGWPDPDTLTRDLLAGICHVSVFARGGVSGSSADALTRWEEDPRPTPSMTAGVGPDGEVTISGNSTVPLMIVAVVADRAEAWTHVISAGDRPEDVAAALATRISADREVSVAGATLTLPGAGFVQARVFAGGTARRRIRSQRQGIQATLWCPRPGLRDALGTLLDSAVADQPRLRLGHGEAAIISYNGTTNDDGPRAQPLYRRDLMLTVEYPTTISRGFLPIAVFAAAPPPAPPVIPDAPPVAPPDAVPDGLHPIRKVVVNIN